MGKVTIEILTNFNTGSGNGVGEIFAIGAAGLFQLKYQDSTNLFFVVTGGWSGSPNFGQYTGLYAAIGKWIHVVITCDFGNASAVPQIYINSAPLSMGTNSTPAGTSGVDDGFRNMGNDPTIGPNQRAMNGAVAYARIYNRFLSPGEIVSLYQNPWRIYSAPHQPMAVIGGANYTLSAVAGSYPFSGQAATTKAGRVVAAVQGSYPFSGQSAGLGHGYFLAAVKGTYAFNGQAATFAIGHFLSASFGPYAFTGEPATLGRGLKIAGVFGSFPFTGEAAILGHGFAVAGAFGSFGLTGEPAIPKSARQFAAPFGSYGFAGQAATPVYSPAGSKVLPGDFGAFAYMGAPANLNFVQAKHGGHFVPLTRKQQQEEQKRLRKERKAREQGWADRQEDADAIARQMRDAMFPPALTISVAPVVAAPDDDDEDVEFLLMYG